MRKTLAFLASLLLVAGLAVNAFAEEKVTGEVISIDSAGKTLVINTPGGQKSIVLQETTKGMKGVKPGMKVDITCIDVEGKSCAKEIKIVSGKSNAEQYREKMGMDVHHVIEGEVVSIDPEGKSVVIKTKKGKTVTVSTKKEPVIKKGKGKKAETVPASELTPGTMVRVDCIDVEGTTCAKKITIIPPKEAVKGINLTGEVVSIDPEKKSVVIKTSSGEQTLYYQKSTKGAPISKIETRMKIKAYCLDVEGKSCIKNIEIEK
jgi:arginine repressor